MRREHRATNLHRVRAAAEEGRGPSQLDELDRIGKTSGVPSAEEQPGFGALLLLKDPEANKAVNFTIWNSEAEMLSGENNGYLQGQLDKVRPLLVEPPTVQHYEVSVLS